MILVDTSVWIDHLRAGELLLVELLDTNRVLVHPLVVGELACGNLNNCKTVLSLLRKLPIIGPATDDEVLFFYRAARLDGQRHRIYRRPSAGSGIPDRNRALVDPRQAAERGGGIDASGFCFGIALPG